MKNLILLLILVMPFTAMAQDDMYLGKSYDNIITSPSYNTTTFYNFNSIKRKAIVFYKKDEKGYYHAINDTLIDKVIAQKIYAYDKTTKKLYVESNFGNYEITLDKNEAKRYKKDKNIPQLESEELKAQIYNVNIRLSNRFNELNKKQKAVEDSITAKRQEQERLNEIRKNDYLKTHKWNILPVGNVPIKCDYCDYTTTTDTLFIFSMKNDSICYASVEDFDLGTKIIKWHVSKIPDYTKKDKDFVLHCNAFKDSLNNHQFDFDKGLIEYMNAKNVLDALDIIKRKTPNGYFVDWGWNNEYGSITFNFTYMNTSPKTIKYIKVYWTVRNDVGDIRGRGSFSGTGPVESMSSASWNWDYSSYYVKGDASKMRITKVVITYMNGTVKTLTGDSIIFN